MQNRSLFTFCG